MFLDKVHLNKTSKAAGISETNRQEIGAEIAGRLALNNPTFPLMFRLDWKLTPADAENLGPADGTRSLRGWSAVLHDDALRVLNFPFGAALYAICLHRLPSFCDLRRTISHLWVNVNRGHAGNPSPTTK